VHTVWDYFDGPRSGIADYRGRPHYFEANWDDEADDYGNTFTLAPVDPETFRIAMEQWAIWRSWERSLHTGEVSKKSHPGLPGTNREYAALDALLMPRRSAAKRLLDAVQGTFRSIQTADLPPPGVMRSLEVEWRDVT
jgi:hypothetical protein